MSSFESFRKRTFCPAPGFGTEATRVFVPELQQSMKKVSVTPGRSRSRAQTW